MSKCSLTNDSFKIIKKKIARLVLKGKPKKEILSFLKDFFMILMKQSLLSLMNLILKIS